MTGTDEQALSRRLHQQLRGELDALPTPAAPVGAVIRRGAARRTRRWVAAASSLAAVAAVAGAVPLLTGRGQPAARPAPGLRAGHVTRTGPSASPPAPTLTGTTFAAGTAQGRPWQLSVRNIADPGARCLPAIMLNATDGYLPPLGAGVAGGIASLAFLTSVPGQPGAGYAALRVSADVTRLTVGLRSGGALTLRPVTVRACGQRLPLAGFSYPQSGVATITAYAGAQVLTRVTPPASLFTGTGAMPRPAPGVWQQLWRTQDEAATGTLASGQQAGARWRISVQLGTAGDCFLGATFDGQVATRAADCRPIAVPPARAITLQRFVIQQATRLTGYAGLASPRTAYLIARLSDGRSLRVQPTRVGGRKYVALALPADLSVTRVIVYDQAGQAIARW